MIDWRWLLILMLACSGCGYLVGWRHHEIATEAKLSVNVRDAQ